MAWARSHKFDAKTRNLDVCLFFVAARLRWIYRSLADWVSDLIGSDEGLPIACMWVDYEIPVVIDRQAPANYTA
jgi:hypothetical protein